MSTRFRPRPAKAGRRIPKNHMAVFENALKKAFPQRKYVMKRPKGR